MNHNIKYQHEEDKVINEKHKHYCHQELIWTAMQAHGTLKLLLPLNSICRLRMQHTCNTESTVSCLYSSCSWSSALYHCTIHPGTGRKPEGRTHVCKTILDRTNTCKGGPIVQVSTRYSWNVTAVYHSVLSRCATWELQTTALSNKWYSSPINKNSLGHRAGVGHHLPRTGSLSPTQSGGKGSGGYNVISTTQYNMWEK